MTNGRSIKTKTITSHSRRPTYSCLRQERRERKRKEKKIRAHFFKAMLDYLFYESRMIWEALLDAWITKRNERHKQIIHIYMNMRATRTHHNLNVAWVEPLFISTISPCMQCLLPLRGYVLILFFSNLIGTKHLETFVYIHDFFGCFST